MQLPWPEFPSAHRPPETIRQLLDYLCWIARVMSGVGHRGGPECNEWRHRVQRAYTALFLPPFPNHGDPYPPDVPPAVNPGIWPDIPSTGIPGMTLRHQLKVIGLLAHDLRDGVWTHARPENVREWDRRISLAREALDHGDVLSMPSEARTRASEKVLAEARAQEKAFKEHASKRALRLEKLRAQTRKAAKEKAAGPETQPKEAKTKAKAPPAKEAKAKAKAPPTKKAKAKAKAPPTKKAKAKAKAARKTTAKESRGT